MIADAREVVRKVAVVADNHLVAAVKRDTDGRLRILSGPEGAVVHAVGEVVNHEHPPGLDGRERRRDGGQVRGGKCDDAAVGVQFVGVIHHEQIAQPVEFNVVHVAEAGGVGRESAASAVDGGTGLVGLADDGIHEELAGPVVRVADTQEAVGGRVVNPELTCHWVERHGLRRAVVNLRVRFISPPEWDECKQRLCAVRERKLVEQQLRVLAHRPEPVAVVNGVHGTTEEDVAVRDGETVRLTDEPGRWRAVRDAEIVRPDHVTLMVAHDELVAERHQAHAVLVKAGRADAVRRGTADLAGAAEHAAVGRRHAPVRPADAVAVR